MGIRADFYIGRGKDAEWIGSVAVNGFPIRFGGVPTCILRSITEDAFRTRVEAYLLQKEDATLPEQGWPWPWDDSRLSDYAYAFDGPGPIRTIGRVWIARFGRGWWDSFTEFQQDPLPGRDPVTFPDMSAIRSVPPLDSPRSGVLVASMNEAGALVTVKGGTGRPAASIGEGPVDIDSTLALLERIGPYFLYIPDWPAPARETMVIPLLLGQAAIRVGPKGGSTVEREWMYHCPVDAVASAIDWMNEEGPEPAGWTRARDPDGNFRRAGKEEALSDA